MPMFHEHVNTACLYRCTLYVRVTLLLQFIMKSLIWSKVLAGQEFE